jgi:hypothetical protein
VIVPKKKKEELFSNIDDDHFLKHFFADKNAKVISDDPGKKDISCMSDGIKTICYTRGMRNKDTYKNPRKKESNRIRNKTIVKGMYTYTKDDGTIETLTDPTLLDYETKYMSETSKKSCFYMNYKNYYLRKLHLIKISMNAYSRKFFRQAKFLVYCTTKSSEHQFFNRVQDKFNAPNTNTVPKWMTKPPQNKMMKKLIDDILANASKGVPTETKLPVNTEKKKLKKAEKKRKKKKRWTKKEYNEIIKKSEKLNKVNIDIVKKLNKEIKHKNIENKNIKKTNLYIGWGNWGRCPNLKGNAPTPGIGHKRRACSHFTVATTPEQNTSNTCPCCQTKTLENPEVGKDHIEKHHLLRCTNEKCLCRWWNRNPVGSFNILRNIFEAKYSFENKTLDLGLML